MTYKTYKCNSFNIHTIKTDKFKTAHMEILFRKPAVREDLCSDAFLIDLLSEASKKYSKRKDLIIRFEELYQANAYGITTRTGNILNTNFILDFLNPEYISDESYLEEVIRLPFEMLQDPNVTNEEFDLKQFNLVKERIKRSINSLKENPVKMCIRKALDLMPGDTPTKYQILGTMDDLEKITPSSIYKKYRKFLKENVCDIFIIGNLDMDKVVEIIKKEFKHRYINELNIKMPVENVLSKKEIFKEEESENVQSNLVMIFNCEDLTEKEKNITFQVFNYIFGNGGITSKLYQSLREKNSLCYGVSSMYLKNDNLLMIHVSLENTNVKKAISLIKKELKNMQKGSFTDEEVEDAKKNLVVSLDLVFDNSVSILNNYIFNCLYDLPSIEDRKELYKSVTKKEIMDLCKKIKLNVTFNLKGKGDSK